MVDDVVGRARREISDATLTLVAPTKPGEQHFILEATATAAVLYLLRRYAGGFLKGAGFDEMAEAHGRKAHAFFERLHRDGTVAHTDLDAERSEVEQDMRQLVECGADDSARDAGEASVVAALVERGALPAQARDAAEVITASIFSE